MASGRAELVVAIALRIRGAIAAALDGQAVGLLETNPDTNPAINPDTNPATNPTPNPAAAVCAPPINEAGGAMPHILCKPRVCHAWQTLPVWQR